MRVTKRVNNSVVLCVDDEGRPVVALGKGIGFTELGAELDLRRVSQTFYSVDQRYVGLLNELPPEMIEFSSQVVAVARGMLSYELNPSISFILADHLSFALQRERKNIKVKMPLALDIQLQYPVECKLATFVIRKANHQFSAHLSKDEVAGVAMCFINNALVKLDAAADDGALDADELTDRIVALVSDQLGVAIDREDFSYVRFASHVRYLVRRINAGQPLAGESEPLYRNVKRAYPDVATIVDQVDAITVRSCGYALSDDERLYLMLHINRIVASSRTAD